MDHVHDPSADGLDEHLRAFLLQELEHIEVPVTLRGLRPELAGNLDDGLDPRAVDLNRVEARRDFLERRRVIVTVELIDELADQGGGAGQRLALADERGELAFERIRLLAPHHLVQQVHALVEDAVRLAGVDFEWPNLVRDVIDDVTDVERIQNPEEEVEVHLETGLSFGLVKPAALLEEQNTEPVES